MPSKRLRRKVRGVRGQGLAEYGLILALVAIVVIVVLSLVGMAVNRGLGLVLGSLGGQKNDPSAASSETDAIDIAQASCYIVTASNETQIIISLNTSPNIDVADLTISTPNGTLTEPITGSPTAYSQTTTISGIDPANCPLTVVVQSKRATAVKPVSVATF